MYETRADVVRLATAVLTLGLAACVVNPVPTPAEDNAALSSGGASSGGDDRSGQGGGTSQTGGHEDSNAERCERQPPSSAPETLGGKRPATVLLPEKWDGCKKRPLVILLHGYSASGVVQDIYLGISQARDEHGFVMLRPEGTMAPDGKQFWNATPFCCDFFKQGPDDVGYVKSLISEAIDKLAVDPARVYLVGHSNGGFMSYRVACEAADMVTGVASLAGAVTPDASTCKPSRPVHVLQMHGTKDTVIKYGGAKGYPSAETAVQRWRGYNGCAEEFESGAAIDYDAGTPGSETTTYSWNNCEQGATVSLWKMTGSKHIPGVNTAFKAALLKHVMSWTRAAK